MRCYRLKELVESINYQVLHNTREFLVYHFKIFDMKNYVKKLKWEPVKKKEIEMGT